MGTPQINAQPTPLMWTNTKPLVINQIPVDDNQQAPTDDTPNEPID